MSKSYNSDNSLASVTTSGIAAVSYTYDNRGNVTAEARTGTLSTHGYSSAYDNADRLTGWTRGSGDTQTWELSPVGDWDSTTINSVTETRVHGPAHELTARGMNSLTYDGKGNLTADGTGKTLAWDFDNKLRSVDTNSDSLADVEYVYDALGRRVEVVTYTGTGESRTSTGWVSVCAGQQVVAEYAHGADANSPLYRYTHSGLYVDDKICRWQPGGEGGTYLYYHLNRQYSTVAITDSNGDPRECYAYTPYGNIVISTPSGMLLEESAVDQRFLFAGSEFCVPSDLLFMRYRAYSATLGRYLSRFSDKLMTTGPSMYSMSMYTYSPLSVVLHNKLRPGAASGDLYTKEEVTNCGILLRGATATYGLLPCGAKLLTKFLDGTGSKDCPKECTDALMLWDADDIWGGNPPENLTKGASCNPNDRNFPLHDIVKFKSPLQKNKVEFPKEIGTLDLFFGIHGITGFEANIECERECRGPFLNKSEGCFCCYCDATCNARIAISDTYDFGNPNKTPEQNLQKLRDDAARDPIDNLPLCAYILELEFDKTKPHTFDFTCHTKRSKQFRWKKCPAY